MLKIINNTVQLFNRYNEATAYLIERFPYTFGVNAQARYWVDTKRTYGDRIMYQTLAPTNSVWSKAKHDGYKDIAIITVQVGDDNPNSGHVVKIEFDIEEKTVPEILTFCNQYALNDIQQDRVVTKLKLHFGYDATEFPIIWATPPTQEEDNAFIAHLQASIKKQYQIDLTNPPPEQIAALLALKSATGNTATPQIHTTSTTDSDKQLKRHEPHVRVLGVVQRAYHYHQLTIDTKMYQPNPDHEPIDSHGNRVYPFQEAFVPNIYGVPQHPVRSVPLGHDNRITAASEEHFTKLAAERRAYEEANAPPVIDWLNRPPSAV